MSKEIQPTYRKKPNYSARAQTPASNQLAAPGSAFFQNKKKLIIVASIIAGSALAAGIGLLVNNVGKVQIVNVAPATTTQQKPYQKCGDVETVRYTRNHKNGTEGAVIGGTGGAVAVGLLTHSWVGAGVGAVAGAVGGDLIQRSHQPNYVAHHSSHTECTTAYHQIQVALGYQVSYLNKNDQIIQIITQHSPPIGSKMKLEELEADQVTPAQQQLMINEAVNSNVSNSR